MAIDLGDTPVGTPPTPEQQEQIRASIGLGATDSMTFSALTLAGQSVADPAATNLVNLAATWNTTGNPSMIYGRVTNTNSGATANLLDIGTVAAGSLFKIDKTGEVTATGTVISTNDFKVGAAKHFHHLGRAAIGSPATGIHTLSNAALNDYDRLQFGGTTSVFPAIKRVAAGLDIKLADDSAFASLGASQLSLSDTWNTNISVMGASGTGTIATITFAAQAKVIPVGSTIVVASIIPAGYNGTFVVTASSLTSVSYANATTTTYSSGGNIQQLFTSIKSNVTDTSSNAGSNLLDLQVGGISKLSVTKTGQLVLPISNNSLRINTGIFFGTDTSQFYLQNAAGVPIFALIGNSGGPTLGSTMRLGWTNSSNAAGLADTFLIRDDVGILAQRNLGNTQIFRLYNATSATPLVDYDRASFSFTSGNLRIAAENSGTSGYTTARGIDFAVSGAVRLKILANGTTNFINDAYFLGPLYSFDGTNSYLGLTSSGGVNKLFTTLASTNKNITISPADVAMMTLTQNGVGIGTTNPVADLDIADTWNAPAISVTGASGNGTTAVITFATQATAIPVGSTVVVAGISPAGYNGTFVVTASNLTSVYYLNATMTTYVSGGTIERLFTSIKLNVTDTASNAGSLLMDLRVGSVSSYSFGKTTLALPPIVNSGFSWAGVSAQNQPCSITRASDDSLAITASLGSGKYISIGGNGYGLSIFSSQIILNTNIKNVYLSNDDNHILAQRNASISQAFRVYNKFTDSITYERGVFDWKTTTDVLRIGTESLGPSQLGRDMAFVTGIGGVVRMTIAATGNVNLPQAAASSGQEQLFVGRIIFAGEGYRVGNTFQIAFSNGADYSRGIGASSSGGLAITNGSTGGQSLQFVEMTAPTAPATNGVRIYAEDNGAGKTRLMALFATGVAQQIAIEP